MRSTTLITVAFAGAATAATPKGFQPASTKDLAVGFNRGAIAAINGVNLPQADVASAPAIGTTERLTGTYTLMMVDADIPPATPGGSTSQLLHWMQSDLVSANTTSEIAGKKVYALTATKNAAALATYIAPNPPNKAPTSHRYVQMLLNTTSLQAKNNMTTLMKEAMTRTNFSAANVLRANGLTVLMGNSFNVTNAAASNSTTGRGSSNSTSGGGTGKGSGSRNSTGPNGINSATLTTDALLSTGFHGSTAKTTAGTSAAAVAPAKATGAINSATLTTDVLISTGGIQASTSTTAATASATKSKSTGAAQRNGVGSLMAGLGAFAAAVVIL